MKSCDKYIYGQEIKKHSLTVTVNIILICGIQLIPHSTRSSFYPNCLQTLSADNKITASKDRVQVDIIK